MFNKIIQKRKMLMAVLAAIFLVLWTLTMVCGNAENKEKILVLSLVLPAVVYGFVSLLYRLVKSNASQRLMRVFFWVFLIAGTLGTIVMITEFIVGFPNGLSPTLGALGGLIMATIHNAAKWTSAEK